MKRYSPLLLGVAILNILIAGSRVTAVNGRNLPLPLTQTAVPTITNVTTNAAAYPNSQIPRYDKFEITFQVDTTASNVYLPYDAAPPAGLTAGSGVSVDAQFTPDNWQTTYIQPAFYYQEFQEETRDGREWFYPNGAFAWKVRFAPDQTGNWQYKLTAQDGGGAYTTQSYSFTVANSANKGFIRVSSADSRYFEFDDGSYFPGLGYNLNYRRVDWIDPTLANAATFQAMADNKIQLIRTWLSQWSIYGSAWSPWKSHNPLHQSQEPSARLRHDAAPPFNLEAGVDPPIARPESEVFLWLSHDETASNEGYQWNFNPCMVLGWESPPLPLQRNTDYRIRVRYKEQDLAGPKVAGQPYGFTVKTGGWLWHNSDESQRCYYPGVGTLLAATYNTAGNWSTYPDPDNPGWSILEGNFNSGNDDFIDRLYLAIENASFGYVFVDYVWLEEDLGGGQFGANIIYKPWMAHQYYFDQRNSLALDKVLELAQQYDIYLKLVILEKHDYVLKIFEFDGSVSPYLPSQNPTDLFYGNGREEAGQTKVRWLQEAWWRYLQARWGYSPNVHSWELLNEGDPGSTRHFILADELGKYFQESFIPAGQQTPHPNMHLVTTSFWNSFPNNSFWGNANYPFVDYADVHHYAKESSTSPLEYIYELSDFDDAALFSQKLSLYHGAQQTNGPGKPVMRGETGWLFDNTDLFAQNATDGVWLHNFIWAGVNPGGLMESYWVGAPTNDHIYEDGSHDHRPMFKAFANFVEGIPLNNGRYQDAAAVSSHPDLRAWGQKDLAAGQAHLWIQNRNHTWRNVDDGAAITAVSGDITLTGFQAGASYLVQWWDTNQPDAGQQIVATTLLPAQPDGALVISVNDLTTDTAVKITPYFDPQYIFLPAVLDD